MKEYNSIVRTKTVYGNIKEPHKMYKKIEFMTFKKATSKMPNRYYSDDSVFAIYPYKWYDIRWIYQIPSYWVLLRIFRNSEAKISKQMHNNTSTITLIIEMLLATKPTIELIKLIITFKI